MADRTLQVQEPGPRQWQAWDTHAWAQERPTKKPDAELTLEGLARLRARSPRRTPTALCTGRKLPILPDCAGARRPRRQRLAWSLADAGGAVNRRLHRRTSSATWVHELRDAAIDTAMQRSACSSTPA
ncbi:MAG: hypothetical protein R2722_18405 [Tessaracoccus sp.]